jgi:hypothetical protein
LALGDPQALGLLNVLLEHTGEQITELVDVVDLSNGLFIQTLHHEQT